MKPLAHWAIHNQQKLRLQGRSDAEIWGLLAGPDGTVQPFRYDRQGRVLRIGADDSQRCLQLDEYGFEVEAEVGVDDSSAFPDT